MPRWRNATTGLIVLVATCLLSAGAARAEKDASPRIDQPLPTPCDLGTVAYDWDFAFGSQGFVSIDCDASGAQVWEYGPTSIVEGAPANVWGTVLDGPYPDETGSGLLSPFFVVSSSNYLVEVTHYFDTEWEYDGCNLAIYPYGGVWEPIGGYTVPVISPSTGYYAWCVDGEPGWTGASGGWRVDCFDLSEFIGIEIALEFDFGSDASVNAAGWYLARVQVGGPAPSVGACCIPETGDCTVVLEEICLEMGGVWHPEWSSCDPNPCGTPPPPSNLSADTQSPTEILVTWEDNSVQEQGFRIERKDGSTGTWQLAQELPPNTTSWLDVDVADGLSYYYRVVAFVDTDESDFSNFANAIAGQVPSAPTGVTATALSPTRVRINWTDASFNELGFLMQRKVGEFGAWQNLPFLPPAGSTEFVDEGVSAGLQVQYRVFAYNENGHSPWAPSNIVTTPENPSNFDATLIVSRGFGPAPGARIEIDRGSGFSYEGDADANGQYFAQNLKVGDRLRASWEAQHWNNCRGYRAYSPYADMGLHLWLDSDVMTGTGDYVSNKIFWPQSEFYLHVGHSIYRYDLGISIQWDVPHNGAYWTNLQTACQQASDYLFDVTDGQVALGTISVWDNRRLWGEVDCRIENSVWPHANVGQYNDCDTWSANEHFYIGRDVFGTLPPGQDWFRTFIHEFGHYAFGFWDEYMTRIGGQANMANLKRTFPDLYPSNYGFMDYQFSITEMSSKNDYRTNYNYGCNNWFICGTVMSEQLWVNGTSCWDQLKAQLEGFSSFAAIQKPQLGWFVSGSSTSPDRDGPTSHIGIMNWSSSSSGQMTGPPIEFVARDSGPGSFEATVALTGDGRPLPGARVYRVGEHGIEPLGITDLRGSLHAVGLKDGDEVRAYTRLDDGCRRSIANFAPGLYADRRMELSPKRLDHRMGHTAYRIDTEAPGASVETIPNGTLEMPEVGLRIWPDEPLMRDPEVVAFVGSVVESLAVEYVPELSRYEALLTIDLADTLFDKTGLFEIGLTDTSGNGAVFTTEFTLDSIDPDQYLERYQGSVDINIDSEDLHEVQLTATASSNVVPFRTPGFDPTPVADIASFHLQQDDVYPSYATLNFAYDDSLLGGIDETTLALYQWDPQSLGWSLVQDSQVSTSANVVSAPILEGGAFTLFATGLSDDSTPPGRVDDFGAVGTPGLGKIELLWTAPGDDGAGGAAEQYIVAYADSLFTEADWDTMPKTTLPIAPAPGGTDEATTIELPKQGHLYYLSIRAKDEASNLGPLSNVTYAISGVADANFLPAAPTDFRAVDAPADSGNVVSLTWQKSYDDGGGKETVVEYRIYRNDPPDETPNLFEVVPAGTESWIDNTVANSMLYSYWVSASDLEHEVMSLENRSLAARNIGMPTSDFTSDAIVGIDDFSWLTDSFAIDSTDAEFDPLFDLDSDGQIYQTDFEIFVDQFRDFGIPTSDPPGENNQVEILYELIPGEGSDWHLNITARNATNLAGYAFEVDFPVGTTSFVGGDPDSMGAVGNMLNRDGGTTPLFLLQPNGGDPGTVFVANVIQKPSSITAPEADGFLAHLVFSGAGGSEVAVSNIVLIDPQKNLNFLAAPSAIEDGGTILRPHLFPSRPNPSFGGTTIRFQIPKRGHVVVRLFDVSGRLVRTLTDQDWEPGLHDLEWDGMTNRGTSVASGVYFYRLEAEGTVMGRKLVFLQSGPAR